MKGVWCILCAMICLCGKFSLSLHPMTKIIKTVCFLTGLTLFLLSCSGRTYKRILDRAEHQNTTYTPITGLDSLVLAADYYDRYGTANEQVRAHYLLGCAYRDAAESPMALESFHDAADRIDTTRADCDYGLLMRVHAQMAELFYQQLLPDEMLDELAAQYRYALLSGDDKAAVNALERRANAYQLQNKPDSVVSIRKKAYGMYRQLGLTEEAALSLGPIIDVLLERGDTSESRRYIELYEAESGVFRDGEPDSRRAFHYFSKGRYYLAIGNPDSARILFRRLLLPERSANQREAGYRGLYLLYRQTGQADSMAKYAELCYQQSTRTYASKTSSNLQQMQSLYNYSRSQKQARQMREKALRNEMTLYIVSTLAAAVFILSFSAWRRRRKAFRLLEEQYNRELAEVRSNKEEMERIIQAKANPSESFYNQLLEKQNREIIAHQQKIMELQEKMNIRHNDDIDKELLDSAANQRVRYVLETPREQMSAADWNALESMMSESLPTFYQEMNKHRRLSVTDYRICMLVRLYYTPKDISILTGNTLSGISVKRSRLHLRIYGEEGSSKDFDRKVRQSGIMESGCRRSETQDIMQSL